MKVLVVILLVFLSNILKAQTYLLIDKGLLKASKQTDSLTKEDIRNGWYPIKIEEKDSVISALNNFINLLKKGLRRENIVPYQSESIQFDIVNIPKAYGDRYEITMSSVTSLGTFSFNISTGLLSNIDNQRRIKNLIAYLTTGKLQKLM